MICDKNSCTGCFACYNVCPRNAIDMSEDDNGFIYPKINEKKCIKCNLCKNVCPVLNGVEKKYPFKCFAVFSKDKEIRKNSTSGGFATTFSKNVIKNGGIVYGAAFDKNGEVKHIRVTKIEELSLLQGSKYVHSYIYDIYRMVKEDLVNKRKVVFFGTPCQIAGLKKFLLKDYKNLLLIDIICHGVPSQKYLNDEKERIIGNEKIDCIKFRNGNNYGLYFIKKNKIINKNEFDDAIYSKAFMMGLILRENCYNCIYAENKRISDITIGDFWGLSKCSKFFESRDKGVSVVAINTIKGELYFEEIKNFFEYEEHFYEEAVKGNTQLMKPTKKHRNANKFKQIYPEYGFRKAYNRLTITNKVKEYIFKIYKKIVKK